ncbi:histidine kinase [Gramella sp. AN32]|uniref:Sensor histidine kinase n=1 Tax=Christiangramia antarctica TaxID=2058158 RepID=A0ABW5WZM3_9FLAO|nr:histidine kinase [Gramella sp. AN32]MCM4155643.1 histidine kinase [Gramella sp. AN32]
MKLRKFFTLFGKRVLIHVFFWICILLLFSFFFGMEGSTLWNQIAFSAFFLPVTIATTYTFIYYLIPNYLLPKRYLEFGLYSLYTFIISSVFIIFSAFYGLVIILNLDWEDNFPLSKSLFFIMITIYLVGVIGSAFSLLKYNYSSAAKNDELKNRILEAQLKLKEQELQYLKMQIHPHFLFNTLNTIYGLSIMQSEKTPEMILQLSDLLDYILYQTKKPLVKLEDEINHIKNYINLEKKRFQDALDIEFNCDPIPESTMLAPMLLLPFVENSFKHGKSIDGKLSIAINLKLDAEMLSFHIENSIQDNSEINTAEGIGLENIKRRLDILYADKYELKVEDTEDLFKVFLKLNTAKIPTDA